MRSPQGSISSTFYAHFFANILLPKSHQAKLKLEKSWTIRFCTKNARIKCWSKWPQMAGNITLTRDFIISLVIMWRIPNKIILKWINTVNQLQRKERIMLYNFQLQKKILKSQRMAKSDYRTKTIVIFSPCLRLMLYFKIQCLFHFKFNWKVIVVFPLL